MARITSNAGVIVEDGHEAHGHQCREGESFTNISLHVFSVFPSPTL